MPRILVDKLYALQISVVMRIDIMKDFSGKKTFIIIIIIIIIII